MHIVSFTRVHVVAIVEQVGGLNDVDVLGGADGLGTLDERLRRFRRIFLAVGALDEGWESW